MARDEQLFEESSQGAVGFVTAVVSILSIVLALGGIVVMGYAFSPDVAGITVFMTGAILCFLGFAIPFTFLPLTGK